jgi:hypothetical protein
MAGVSQVTLLDAALAVSLITDVAGVHSEGKVRPVCLPPYFLRDAGTCSLLFTVVDLAVCVLKA